MKVLVATVLGIILATGGMVGAAAAIAAVSYADETQFLSQNEQAMIKMMRGMAMQPSGDIDKDFVALMVPHHQGAIDMAMAMLRFGRNVQLRRLAQEIIVTQQQEITAMRLAVGEPLQPSKAAPTGPSSVSVDQLPSRRSAARLAGCVSDAKPQATGGFGP